MESAAEGEGIWGQEGGFGSRTIFSLCHVPKAVGFGAMVARGNLGFPAEGPRCGGRERGINVLGHSSSPPRAGTVVNWAQQLPPLFLIFCQGKVSVLPQQPMDRGKGDG